MNVNVRLAMEADLSELLAMMADFNALEGIPWNRPRTDTALRRMITDSSLGCALIAETHQEICGYAVLAYGYDLEFGGRDAFVNELYLRESVRGRGLGSKVLEAVESIAKDNGVLALHLMVHPENAPALSLYRRLGFVQTPRIGLTKILQEDRIL